MGRPRSFDEQVATTRAAALFAELGYEGTSVDDLVRGLGVHRGSLYSTFGSKRALYLRVLREHVAGLHRDADLTLLLRAAVERAPVDPEVAAVVRRGLHALQQSLAPGQDGDPPGSALAQLLGEQIVRRATDATPTQEDT